MTCDICGSNRKAYLTNMEGAKLYVCDLCNPKREGRIKIERKIFTPKPKFTKLVKDKIKKEFKPIKRNTQNFAPKRYKSFELEDYDLIDDYGAVLRKAREDKNITLEDFAKKIRESASFLMKIEQGKLKPNDKILLKVYDFLGVNLVRNTDEDLDSKEDTKQEQEIKSVDQFTEVTFNNKKKIVF